VGGARMRRFRGGYEGEGGRKAGRRLGREGGEGMAGAHQL
jgi:hypothetical protein